MNAETFAIWLERQGYRTVRTQSSYWFEAGPRVLQAFPYHRVIEPDEDELSALLRSQGAAALRYSTPVDAPWGKLSYHVVCEGPYTLEALPRQARQNVQRGMEYVSVEPISLERLATEGWRLRAETLARQGRSEAEQPQWWRRVCRSAEGLPGFEAWGAIHAGELVAAFLGFECEGCYLLPYEQSATAHLEHRVNNAIFYCVIARVLQRPEVSSVFFCLQSLDAPCSVDQFKFRMGFTAKPVRQRVVLHSWLRPVVNVSGELLHRQLAKHAAHRPAVAKGAGLLHFYLEGRRPAAEQEWPDTLADRRNELLAQLSASMSLGKAVTP